MRAQLIVATSLVYAAVAGAQEETVPFELRPYVGVFVPTGKLADEFKSALDVGSQLAFEVSPRWHLLGNVAFTYGTDKLPGIVADDATYIWQYDIGGEFTAVQGAAGSWLARTFVGAGAGGRTYDYKAAGLQTSSSAAGYLALGGETKRGLFAVRCEMRDYLSKYKSPLNGNSATRNDLRFAVGMAFHL